jgi:hypothetical protein
MNVSGSARTNPRIGAFTREARKEALRL